MEELWKDIPDFEGLYQVSNIGRVRSVDVVKECRSKYGKKFECKRKGKVLKPWKGVGKYLTVMLYKEGVPELYFVHRLMAIAFLENKHLHSIVSFKDGNRNNVCLDNLQWGRKSS